MTLAPHHKPFESVGGDRACVASVRCRSVPSIWVGALLVDFELDSFLRAISVWTFEMLNAEVSKLGGGKVNLELTWRPDLD